VWEIFQIHTCAHVRAHTHTRTHIHTKGSLVLPSFGSWKFRCPQYANVSVLSIWVVQKFPFTWFERNPQSMTWEILADLLMKFLLFRKALKRFRTYHHLCLIKLFIFCESLHTGICLTFNVGLHSEQTFHITVTPWWSLLFHYVRQALLLLLFFHILEWLGIQTCFKLVMRLLKFKNHFWSCGIPIICSRKLLTRTHTHTHTHTLIYAYHRSREQVSVTYFLTVYVLLFQVCLTYWGMMVKRSHF
jgi:hypothetical protein